MLTTLRHGMGSPAALAFLTAAAMTGCAAHRIRNGALRCTSRMASHCSSVIFWITESQVYPALFTMMSNPPKSSTAVCTNRSPKSASVTLPTQVTAWPPAASMAATVSLAGSASRSLTTTFAPSLASFSAISRPMPRPEPETMATLPSRVPMLCKSFSCVGCVVASECDDGVAGEGDGAVVERDGQVDRGASFAVDVVDRRDRAGGGRLAVYWSDGGEAHPIAADRLRVNPVGQQPTEVGHRQHAVREDIVQAC